MEMLDSHAERTYDGQSDLESGGPQQMKRKHYEPPAIEDGGSIYYKTRGGTTGPRDSFDVSHWH